MRMPGDRPVESPSDGAGKHGARERPATKMWHAPEDLAAAANEVPADVMKPWTHPAGERLASLVITVLRKHRGRNLDVLKQRRFSATHAPPIEMLACPRPLRQSVARREQEEECEQHGDVQRNRADGVPPQREVQ